MANAQSRQTALEAANQWPEFPAFFAVWGEDDLVGVEVLDLLVHYIAAQNSTHASGWALALEVAEQSLFSCQYYFTLDDDMSWTVTERGHSYANSKVIGKVLTQFLVEYRPAVVVFDWEWGNGALGQLKEMNDAYSQDVAQPATDFDNGCLIFHESIVSFFIPLWLGDGHTAMFITQHALLNYFIPVLF